jgi:RND superfamily putative drug exporter
VAALVVVAWLMVGAVGGPYQAKINEVTKNDNSSFLPANAESTAVSDAQQRMAQQRVLSAVVIYERQAGLTAADRSAIDTAVTGLGAVPGVVGKPVAVPSTKDDQAVEIVVPLSPPQPGQGTNQLNVKIDALRAAASAGLPGGLVMHVTGPAGLIADFAGAFAGIDGLLLLVTTLVVALILVVVYRSPLLPLIVLATAGLALSLGVFVVYQLAKHDVLTVNGQSQGILLILVFGAATDYSLLLVSRFREELRRTDSVPAAMRVAWRASVEPISASAGTVVLGLLCLLFSDLNSNRGLGPVGAIGIVASLLAALTFLPGVLLLLGRAAFWPARPTLGSAGLETRGLWAGVSRLVGRRPRAVWLTCTVLLLAAVAFVPQLRASGVAQRDQLLGTADSVVGQDVLLRHFPGGTGSPVVVIANAGRRDQVIAAVRDLPGLVPYSAPAGTAPAGTVPKVVDGRTEIDLTLTDAADSSAALATVARVRTAVHAVPGADAQVGGQTAIQLDVRDTSTRDRGVIIPIVLIVIFLVLALLLRALVVPLVLIVTVVLSFAATLGVGALVFNHLFGFPGADPSIPLFAFIFLVALGIDYNIFLMTRIREETARHGTREGTLRGLSVTGGVITSAGVVLAATFSALAVLPILFLAQIAFLVAFGVLADTLLVRSLLVPALTVDLGRVVWWPSRLWRRERTGQAEHNEAANT